MMTGKKLLNNSDFPKANNYLCNYLSKKKKKKMKRLVLFLALTTCCTDMFSQISFIEKKEIKEEPQNLVLKYDSLYDLTWAHTKSGEAGYYGLFIGQDVIYVGGIENGDYHFKELTTKGKGKRSKTMEIGTNAPKIGAEFTIIDVSHGEKIILQDKLTGKKYIYKPHFGYDATEWVVKGHYEKMKQLYSGKKFYYIKTKESTDLFEMETDEELENVKDFSVWECIDVSIKIDTDKSNREYTENKILSFSTNYTKSRIVLVFKNKEGEKYYSFLTYINRRPIRLNLNYERKKFSSEDVFSYWFPKSLKHQIVYAGINEEEILVGKFLNEGQYQKLCESLRKVDEMKAERAAADAKAKEIEERRREERVAERAAADAKAKEDAKKRAAARKNNLIAKYGEAVANDILKGQVRLGWTKEMCIEAWGRPKDINRTTGSYGVHEQWVYGLKYYLYFENGKLTGIQD